MLRNGFDENKSLFSQKGAYGQIGRENTKRQTYSAMVTCMDRCVGQIFQAFKNMHIEDNTLVLFLSITAHKKERAAAVVHCVAGSFRNGQVGVRSPAVVRWPEGFKKRRMINQLSGYVDVMSTLLNIAGVSKKNKKPFGGINIIPVLNDNKKQIDGYFYLGYGAVIHGHWKFIKANSGNSAMKQQKDLLFNIKDWIITQ